MNKILVLLVFFALSISNIGTSQCTFEANNNGYEYSVDVNLEITDVIYTQSGSTCNIQFEVTYDVQIDVTNKPSWWDESLYNLQGNLDCAGASGKSFFDLPNGGGSGTVISAIFSMANENCEDVVLDCPITVTVQGPELDGSGTCHVFKNSALPISLSSFEYKNSGQKNIELQWSTASEINFSHFEVEESYDLDNWQTIANIRGFNNTSGATYSHIMPQESRNRYLRLKMVDLDSYTEYSDALMISSNGTDKFFVYPNPSSDRIQLSKNTGALVMIYNSMGVATKFAIDNNQSINIESLPIGYYIIQTVEENGASQSAPFIKR